MQERVVIIGGGIAGWSTALGLVRRQRHDVVVVEQEPVPGTHSSGRNAAILRHLEPTLPLVNLATQAMYPNLI